MFTRRGGRWRPFRDSISSMGQMGATEASLRAGVDSPTCNSARDLLAPLIMNLFQLHWPHMQLRNGALGIKATVVAVAVATRTKKYAATQYNSNSGSVTIISERERDPAQVLASALGANTMDSLKRPLESFCSWSLI